MPLHVPSGQEGILVDLVRLSEQEQDALLQSLEDSDPKLELREYSRSVAEGLPASIQKVEDMVSALGSLYATWSYRGSPPEAFADEVIQACRETGNEDLDLSEEEETSFRRFLTSVLSLDETLGLTAKANDLRGEAERQYVRSRSLTDLRPVFEGDLSDEVSSSIIIHTLRLTFLSSNGSEDEFFVEMTTEDVEDLHSTLERALDKAKGLESAANDNFPIIGSR